MTSNEAKYWALIVIKRLQTFDTDCGPIGVLICYDAEFFELPRLLVD